jgi:hypothetical protein
MPYQTFKAQIIKTLATPHTSHFRTEYVAELQTDLAGIIGDRHHGFTRPAGAREPWFPRGTQIRSGRQLSIVSLEDLREIAQRLEITHLDPAWIGANILVSGIPNFTRLPWGTRLVCAEGAVLVNEGENAPCRFAGAEIARHHPDCENLDRHFPKAAIHLRGIVASIERAGPIAPGSLTIKVPEQNTWTGGTIL